MGRPGRHRTAPPTRAGATVLRRLALVVAALALAAAALATAHGQTGACGYYEKWLKFRVALSDLPPRRAQPFTQLELAVSDSSGTCDVALYITDCNLPAFHPQEQNQRLHKQHGPTVADGFVQHNFNPVVGDGGGAAVVAEALDPKFAQLLEDQSVCVWVQSFGHSSACEAAMGVHGWFRSVPDCEFIPECTEFQSTVTFRQVQSVANDAEFSADCEHSGGGNNAGGNNAGGNHAGGNNAGSNNAGGNNAGSGGGDGAAADGQQSILSGIVALGKGFLMVVLTILEAVA